jgi:hypothetical protein
MTEAIDHEAIESPATLITEIEAFLKRTAHRETFTSSEVQDLLLDLHSLAQTPDLN